MNESSLDRMELPAGAEGWELSFAENPGADAEIWTQCPGIRVAAVAVRRWEPREGLPEGAMPTRMLLVTIPGGAESDLEAVQRWQAYVDRRGTAVDAYQRSILLTLHGAQVIWQPHLIIAVAPPDRLTDVSRAAVLASAYEHELRALERRLDERWDEVQVDARLAFEFAERDMARRGELADRFQRTVSMRTRLERLAPQIQTPHVHPPTLASQIGERLRERLHMAERLELADGKLEAQERIYELCSQRSSEFVVARTGHLLEWVIIILLLSQTVLLIIEFLTSRSATA